MSINTDLLHAEQLHAKLWGSYEPTAMAHVSPIYQTSTYVLENFDAALSHPDSTDLEGGRQFAQRILTKLQ